MTQLALDLEAKHGRIEAPIGARLWREQNPRGWAYIERWAAEDFAASVRISNKRYAERLRGCEFVDRGDSPYDVDNRFPSIWSRMLLEEHPEYAPLLPTRDGKHVRRVGR